MARRDHVMESPGVVAALAPASAIAAVAVARAAAAPSHHCHTCRRRRCRDFGDLPVASTIGSQLFRIRLNPCPGNGWPDLGDMVGPRPPLLRRAAPPVPVPGGHLARPSSRGRQGVGARMVHRRPSGSALDGPPVRHHGPPACRRLSPRAHDRPAVRQRGSIRSSRRSSGQQASPRRRTGSDILDASTCGALGAGGTR